jgi:hypothetical protein
MNNRENSFYIIVEQVFTTGINFLGNLGSPDGFPSPEN